MKKLRVLTILSFILFFTLGASKTFAGGCKANCKFSSCIIGGCTAQWACACYAGIASCKCEPNTPTPGSGGGGPKNSTSSSGKVFNAPEIRDFNTYAARTGFSGLIAVGHILQQFTEENFDAVFESYKDQIEQLPPKESELFKLYVEN
jgi:hypothetical protein